MTGYAWDPQPLLELISSTALITLIIHQTFKRIFTVDRRRTWLARLTVLFILVLLTLQSISRYDLCPLCSPSSCNISLQTTHSPVEENPPSAIRLEASSRSRDCSHSLQQDKPRQDCFPSENISSQWTSRPSDLKIQERDWLGWGSLGAQLGETYRQSVQQISSTDWRYQGVPGQLQHLNSPPPPLDCCQSPECRPPGNNKYQLSYWFVNPPSHRDVLTVTQPSVVVRTHITGHTRP